ncbi:MAG: pyridoxal-phosphate dependent enzyme, partial [Candidatus Rokubacteria bacterium]|nr:pyridoxal-phosphate dependent enzyme [Candidatus Rokubacteria bacterium]
MPVTIAWDAYRSALPSIAHAVGRTPLVRLNRVTAGLAPPIHLKLEWYGATGSLKDRIYLHMFERAEARGDLTPGMRVLECSTRQRRDRVRVGRRRQGLPVHDRDAGGHERRAQEDHARLWRRAGLHAGRRERRGPRARAARRDPRRCSGGLLGARAVRQRRQRRGPLRDDRPRDLGAVRRARRRLRGRAGQRRHADRRRPLPPRARCGGPPLRCRARRVRAPGAPAVGPARHRGHRRRLHPAEPRRRATHRRDHDDDGGEHRDGPPALPRGGDLLRHLDRLQRRRRPEARAPPPG